MTAALLILSLHLNWYLNLPSSPGQALREFHRQSRPLEYRLEDDVLESDAEALRRALEHVRQHPGRYRA